MSALTGEWRQQRGMVVFGMAALATWLLFESQTTKNVFIWVEQTQAALMALVLLHPLAAVVGVWVGGRPAALGTVELESRAVRSRALVELRPVLVAAATMTGGYLVVVALRWVRALLSLAGPAEPTGLEPVVLVITVATLTTWTMLGAALAKTPAPRWVLVPIVGLVAWLHPVFLDTPATEGLAQVSWNIWLPQGIWNPDRGVASALYAAALVVFAATLLATHVASRSRKATAIGMAAVVLAAAGWNVVAAGPWQTVPTRDQMAPLATLHCQPVGATRVCVDPAHRAVLDDAVPDLRQQVAGRATEPLTVRLDYGIGLRPDWLETGVVGMGMEIRDGRMRMPEQLVPVLVQGGVQT